MPKDLDDDLENEPEYEPDFERRASKKSGKAVTSLVLGLMSLGRVDNILAILLFWATARES
jgi:hypothetical protein